MILRELEQLGSALKSAKVSTVVVDTQTGYTSNGEGRALADTLCGHHIFLPRAAKGKEIASSIDSLIDSMSR
jgi:predicted RNA-binding protein with TRAM domain